VNYKKNKKGVPFYETPCKYMKLPQLASFYRFLHEEMRILARNEAKRDKQWGVRNETRRGPSRKMRILSINIINGQLKRNG